MAQRASTWCLTIRKGPKVGSTYPLHGGTITIGRQAGNHIIIDDPKESLRNNFPFLKQVATHPEG